ncbi:MAG: carotenoid biosynthesis protein [Sphaerochaeta sp.]|jgi:putative membrane protein|uniref:Carotenoid biosynthesis protein n=1 Tax=Sphaerochaeta halotolerans TaxID=2293840 RepID=A0A372MKC5_9SPIR|nr:carotenoid biosynthesis protein [Sphaerochaeta halotolerans]RFU95640.1 carotenoid biosynthesis protein [Sphaerochaeta halotolerans]
MFNLKKEEYLIIYLLVIFYLVGTIAHIIDATLPLMLLLTPYSILLTSFTGFFFDVREENKRLLLWSLITFQITLFLEIVGVATSLVFGAYTYGDTLGVKLLGVPLLIGINWTIIILGIADVVRQKVTNNALAALITASLTVLFDYVMEPVAIAFDYWNWTAGSIPQQNYIDWFAIAFLFSYLFFRNNLHSANKVPTIIVMIQFLFFLSLQVFAI